MYSTKPTEFSFRRGFSQVKNKDIRTIRNRIMSRLGIGTRGGWMVRLNGVVEPRVSEAKAIEEIFAEYGITDIWGGEE
jgi:hypothetical protein